MRKKSDYSWPPISALSLLFFGAFWVPSMQASIAAFSTGDFLVTGIGDELNTGMDKFTLTGVSNQRLSGLDEAHPQTAVIGAVSFESGMNCIVCGTTFDGIADVNFTFDSVTKTLEIPYRVRLNYYSFTADKLRFFASAPLSFELPDHQLLQVTAQAFDGFVSSGGVPASGDLTANFEILDDPPSIAPEPHFRYPVWVTASLASLAAILKRRRGSTPA